MNNYQLCSFRDKQIILALSQCKALNTNQLVTLFFKGKTGLRKCQTRLKFLANNEFVQVIERPFFDSPNIYYLKDAPALSAIPHIIMVGWVYVWFCKKYEVLYWEQEVDFNILQCDAICQVKDKGEIKWFFIELDRAKSHNTFVKPEKYTELYEKEGNTGSELSKRYNLNKFPRIVIVTDSIRRGQNISKIVKDKNRNPCALGFDLYLFDEIVKEAKQ